MSADILKHLDKNNLHHAYLVEGMRDEILLDVFEFIESLGIKTKGNPDFSLIKIDNLKIDQARELRSMALEKGYDSNRKFFVICINSATLDAEQALLKMFEEPIENTHFFLIVPSTDSLLSTLVSRFYTIKSKNVDVEEIKKAENFLKMPLVKRIDFLKELLVIEEEDDEVLIEYSPKAKALKFLNALEVALHTKNIGLPSVKSFQQIFKVREFLRQPGSSAKTLMEGVALGIPAHLN